jgi:carbon-monoxide dehydrogenase medium subunit
MDKKGTCTEARISLGGVAATPVRATEAEESLSGKKITDELIQNAATLSIESTDAESDYHASADYRREMTRVLVERSLKEALMKAQGGQK